jgi:hypothetical protein
VLGGLALDASFQSGPQPVRSASVLLDAVAAPCRPDAVRFEEQSSAAPVFEAQPASRDAMCSASLVL